jgi:hypothetical protein
MHYRHDEKIGVIKPLDLHGLPEWVIILYLLRKGLFIIASFSYNAKTVGPCCSLPFCLTEICLCFTAAN